MIIYFFDLLTSSQVIGILFARVMLNRLNPDFSAECRTMERRAEDKIADKTFDG